MTILLLLVFIITEIAFAGFGLTGSVGKREWSRRRLIADAAELGVFAAALLLPGVDLSFRFKGLALMLVIRLVPAAVFVLIRRRSEKTKSRAGIVMSAFTGIMMLGSAMLPAFIFVDYKGRPTTGEYTIGTCSAILTDSSRTEQFESDGSMREVPVHIFYPAETDGIEKGSLPLVFFSHGAFGWYQSNMSTYRELASNGYVVVSVEHPYHSLFTKDTSGRLIIADRGFLNDVMEISGSSEDIESEAEFNTEQEWIELRSEDMSFAVDTFKKAADDGDLSCWTITEGGENKVNEALSLIDTGKIGLMGHSLGGAASVTVGRRGDISAVIDLDGTMIGEQTGIEDGRLTVNSDPYPIPLLSLDNDEHHFGRIEAKKEGYIYSNNVVLDNAVNAYSTYIKGSEHMNFTDLPLISPFLADKLGAGDIDAGECIDTVNGLVLGFFDSFLKGEGTFTVNESY